MVTKLMVILLGSVIALASGCSSRADAGRLLGVDIGLSIGEQATVMTTAKDDTEAGEKMLAHRPAAESANSSGWKQERGFQTIGGDK